MRCLRSWMWGWRLWRHELRWLWSGRVRPRDDLPLRGFRWRFRPVEVKKRFHVHRDWLLSAELVTLASSASVVVVARNLKHGAFRLPHDGDLHRSKGGVLLRKLRRRLPDDGYGHHLEFRAAADSPSNSPSHSPADSSSHAPADSPSNSGSHFGSHSVHAIDDSRDRGPLQLRRES